MSNENLTETKPVEQTQTTEQTNVQANENLLTTKTENAEQTRGKRRYSRAKGREKIEKYQEGEKSPSSTYREEDETTTSRFEKFDRPRLLDSLSPQASPLFVILHI